MSTAEARAVQAPASSPPVLVAFAGDRKPRTEGSAGAPKPVNAHRFFYTLGYLGLVPVTAAGWVGAFNSERMYALYVVGALFVGLGGFGVLIHTLFRPNERKVRHLLLALASLALVAASAPLVGRIAREVYATSMILRLQPLAEEVLRDARIRNVGAAENGWVRVNGFRGPAHGDGGFIEGQDRSAVALADVLARDGISLSELHAYLDRLERAGIAEVERVDGRVLFEVAGVDHQWLLYVPPGRALPRAGTPLKEGLTRWHADPLGGGWYLVLRSRE